MSHVSLIKTEKQSFKGSIKSCLTAQREKKNSVSLVTVKWQLY